MNFEYGWQPEFRVEQLEIYHGLVDALKPLHADHDDLAAKLREKGLSDIPSLDASNRLSGNEINHEPLQKPNVSDVKIRSVVPQKFDGKDLRQDDSGISNLASELNALYLKLADRQNLRDHLQAQHDILAPPLQAYQSDTARLERLIETAKQRVDSYRICNQTLRALDDKTDGPDFVDGYPPLSMLGEWANATLKGRVVIHPDALETAARLSDTHRKPGTIFAGLRLLANEFYDQKMSGSCSEDTRAALRTNFTEKAKLLGLKIGKTPNKSTLSQIRGASSYRKAFDGKVHDMTQHLSRGGALGIESHVRIYFAWDEDKDRILVGHLPTHLEDTFTPNA